MSEQTPGVVTRGYPAWLQRAEAEALRIRRGAIKSQPPVAEAAPHIGLALSGGGIRSAIFSLGLVQALARNGVLPRIDYLSTVSGGGYIGSFLGALYARGASDAHVTATLTQFPASRQLEWLRSNGRFLAPNGSGANWLAGAVLLRNWLSLSFVVAPVAFCLSFIGVGARAALDLEGVELAFDEFLAGLDWPPHVGGLTLSPLVVLPIACAVYWMLPCAVAYWMVNSGQRDSRGRIASALGVALALLLPPAVAYANRTAPWHPFPFVSAIAATTAAVFFLALGLRRQLEGRGWVPSAQAPRFDPFGPDSDSIARNKLSEWLKGGFMAFAFTALVAVLDSVGFAAFQSVRDEQLSGAIDRLGALGSAIAALVLGTHRLLALFGAKRPQSKGVRVPVQVLVGGAAVLLILLGDVVVSTSTYWITVPYGDPDLEPELWIAGLGFAVSFVTLALLGRFVAFVNQSSLGPIYEARLTRAFVGASNPNRWATDVHFKGKESPTEPIPGDQITWDKYLPHLTGGPLHLINVTVNETVDPRVQLHQPDRKGMIMAVGPIGVSLGVRHHARWNGDAPPPDPELFQVFPTGKELLGAEKLPVGHWVAISGAAVATGLGQLSHWGASLLCGVFNMRLGYWWHSNVSAKDRKHQAHALSLGASLMSVLGYLFPMYRLLAAEFLDRFPGTALESWYLTDGGHLENTACYELIRRRVPFILCADNGADPSGECSDLANLVRLARVDFGAEIEFLGRAQLDALLDPALAPLFGTTSDLKHPAKGKHVYAALASIRYPEQQRRGWLIVIKPHLIGGEPVDVSGYASLHPDFPQQSTSDQNFDDAQWEAYRKLGDHIGTRLFDAELPAGSLWRPSWLDESALELLEQQYVPDSTVRRRPDEQATEVAKGG